MSYLLDDRGRRRRRQVWPGFYLLAAFGFSLAIWALVAYAALAFWGGI